jgi:L-alanine-DL-glutamate epimerase-like enolase superfamily enzyme
MRTLSLVREIFPIAGRFVLSRGAKTEARVVVAEIAEGEHRGRGECVPYARYGESIESVTAAIEGLRAEIERGLSREALQQALPAGAARNALDCALWDLEAKQKETPVWFLAGLREPKRAITAYTISLDAPDAMAEAAAAAKARPLLKVKLGREMATACITAVRAAAPEAKLIVDANEAWDFGILQALAPALAQLKVALVEQPLAAGEDRALEDFASPVPLCADESVHDTTTLDALPRGYSVINIKLDKTGGLTEAIKLAHAARARNLDIMVGCMVASSLAMAPAFLLARGARYVDLDGPLMLARDRTPAIPYDGSLIYPAPPALWG